jgi:hypothetical protein
MALPMNQWNRCGSIGPIGFGPMRRNRPSSPSGIFPCTSKSKRSDSASTGVKFPDRNGLVAAVWGVGRGSSLFVCRLNSWTLARSMPLLARVMLAALFVKAVMFFSCAK